MNRKAVGREKLIILKENRLPYFKTKIIMLLQLLLFLSAYITKEPVATVLRACSWSLGLYKTADFNKFLIGI